MRLERCGALAALTLLLAACQPTPPTTPEDWRRHGQAELAAWVAQGLSLQGDALWMGEGGERARFDWQLQAQGEALHWQVSADDAEQALLAVRQDATQISLRLAPPGARRARVYAGAIADLPLTAAASDWPRLLAVQTALRQPQPAETLLQDATHLTQQWPRHGLGLRLARDTGLLQSLDWQAPDAPAQRVQLTHIDWRDTALGGRWPAALHLVFNERAGRLRVRIAPTSSLGAIAHPAPWTEAPQPLAALAKDRLWQRLTARPPPSVETAAP